MKQTKKLTREQKILLSNRGLNPVDYRLVRERPTHLIVYNTQTRTEEAVLK